MGLDITFTRRKSIVCPACGEILGHIDVTSIDAGGRGWYPLLETLGYYVPRNRRTEENNWYGKDMVLSDDQVNEAYQFTKKTNLFGADALQSLIATDLCEKDSIVVNADW